MTVEIQNVQHIDYFKNCTDDELDYIQHYLGEKKYEKSEMIMLQGSVPDYLFFVVSGAVKVYKTSEDGKEQILHITPKGDSFGDIGIFDGGTVPATMMAMTPTTLYYIQKDDLHMILQKFPKVALNALRALAIRVRRDSRLVEELSFTQVINRVAGMLLKYIEWEAEAGIHLTQQDMANMVGTSREMVNKSIKYMEDRGAIRTTRKGIDILDQELLTEIAHTWPLPTH